MYRRGWGRGIVSVLLCIGIGLVAGGCPKKATMKQEPSETVVQAPTGPEPVAPPTVKEPIKATPLEKKGPDAAKAAEEERRKREEEAKRKAEELARRRAEEAKRAEEARRKAEEERRRAEEERRKAEAARKIEQSLVTKKEPGIEGEVKETPLLRDIHFDFDKYNIRPADGEILRENAAVLKTIFQRDPNAKVQIEGHCDERGTAEYNLALGERRAQSAKQFLISLGLPADRITTISYGEDKPLDPRHNEEAWAKNRRAHFIILPK